MILTLINYTGILKKHRNVDINQFRVMCTLRSHLGLYILAIMNVCNCHRYVENYNQNNDNNIKIVIITAIIIKLLVSAPSA